MSYHVNCDLLYKILFGRSLSLSTSHFPTVTLCRPQKSIPVSYSTPLKPLTILHPSTHSMVMVNA